MESEAVLETLRALVARCGKWKHDADGTLLAQLPSSRGFIPIARATPEGAKYLVALLEASQHAVHSLESLLATVRTTRSENGELRHRLNEANAKRGKTADQLDLVKRSASGSERALRARLDDAKTSLDAAEAEIAELRAKVAELEDRVPDADAGEDAVEEELRNGGTWLGAVRTWLQWNTRDGATLPWTSTEHVAIPFNQFSEIALRVAVAAVVAERKQRGRESVQRAKVLRLELADAHVAQAYAAARVVLGAPSVITGLVCAVSRGDAETAARLASQVVAGVHAHQRDGAREALERVASRIDKELAGYGLTRSGGPDNFDEARAEGRDEAGAIVDEEINRLTEEEPKS